MQADTWQICLVVCLGSFWWLEMIDWNAANADATWDAGELACGELVNELRRRVRMLQPRQTLHLIATDTGARMDIRAWCRVTGHTLKQADHPNYLIERKEE